MPKKSAPERPKQSGDLRADLARLQTTLNHVEKSLSQQVRWKPVMLRSFLNGMLSVLGALAAVAIVVPILVWFLRGVQWPPLIDAFVQRMIIQIDERQRLPERQTPPAGSSSSSVPTIHDF
ncbi:MAG TPA: hypothetical protein PKV72_03890 [Candidatus Peribacteria bacterium]|nr:hypothetical protein [Candidatus Peribacteria bacterium]